MFPKRQVELLVPAFLIASRSERRAQLDRASYVARERRSEAKQTRVHTPQLGSRGKVRVLRAPLAELAPLCIPLISKIELRLGFDFCYEIDVNSSH